MTVDIQKFMMRGAFKQAKAMFRKKFGEDLPLDLDDFETVYNQMKKDMVETDLMFEMVRGLFIHTFGQESYDKYEKSAQKKASKRMDNYTELIEKIILTVIISQGLELGADGLKAKPDAPQTELSHELTEGPGKILTDLAGKIDHQDDSQ